MIWYIKNSMEYGESINYLAIIIQTVFLITMSICGIISLVGEAIFLKDYIKQKKLKLQYINTSSGFKLLYYVWLYLIFGSICSWMLLAILS